MLHRSLLRGSVATLALALVTGARAASAQRVGEATPRSTSYWYGWETASTDAASIAVIVLGSAIHAPVVTYAGVGGVLFGAPVVHFANGRGDVGVASFALRVLLPLLGAGIGYAAAGSCQEDPKSTSLLGNCFLHGFDEAGVGGLIGLGSAMVLDALVLSYGKRETAAPRKTDMLQLTSAGPSYDPLTRTASLGLGGRF